MNLEELVTKDYLAAEFAKERALTDRRFEEVNVQFAEIRGNFKTLYWILAIIVAATVTPWLERLMSFIDFSTFATISRSLVFLQLS